MSQESNQSADRNGRGGQEPQQGQGGQQPQSDGGQQASTAQGQQAGTQSQGQGSAGREQQSTGEQIVAWFTEKLVRVVAVLIGLAMLLFALGQIAGVNLLSVVGDFITSSIGGYIIIAFFALLIIIAATRDWNISDR